MNKKALCIVLSLVFFEWVDFSLYLYLAKSVFSREFFPTSSYSLTLSFALFAAAFLARPLGGWLFGREADYRGRRTPLMFSAGLMGVSTLGIAMLPSYSVIGIAATWGILILRIGQGLALGGELHNSAMYVVEHESKSPLVKGSYVAASAAMGLFIGGAIAAIIQMFHVESFWRIIFLLVGFASIYVCRLRKSLTESPEFQANHSSMWQMVKEEWAGVINIALLAAPVSVTVYICNVYWISLASDQGFWSPITCVWAGSIAQLLSATLALFFARVYPASQLMFLIRSSLIAAIITAPVLFYFTLQGVVAGVLLGLGFYVLCNALFSSSMFYFLYLQLPAKFRCRGVSTTWTLAASLGAISLPLAQQSQQWQWIWLAPAMVSGISLISYCFLGRGRLGQGMSMAFSSSLSFPRSIVAWIESKVAK